MIKKVEVLANVAVIITSIVVCTVLVKRYLLSPTKGQAAAVSAPLGTSGGSSSRSIERGTKIGLPSIDWTRSDRTLILALSTSCHFCSESAPLYEKLQQQRKTGVRLLALFPQPLEESRRYLSTIGVSVDDVVQSPLSVIGASGTPTLILVDSQGAVIDSWVGKLSESAAEPILSLVTK